ncbi:MAG TPA: signal peptide peptidase SppA [Candidatus Binataceae bacterium]|nr:signal peptide peptidase SppA [Candidatus Binataceae bacterium]
MKRVLRWLLRLAAAFVALCIVAFLSEYISHRVKPGSVLVVTFNGPVVERGSANYFGVLSQKETPLNVMRVALSKAAKDPRIVGLAVKVIDAQMELSQAQEIAGLIDKFKASGKWTAAYVETAGEMSPGNLPYLVAAATGDVSLMPEGELDLVGVGIREMFARGTLDWIGVRPDFAAFGKYKSAANIFTEKDFTPAQHEEDDALVGAMFDQIVGQIAKERGITTDQVRAVVDQAPLNAALSIKNHMVERLEFEDAFTERLKNLGGSEHQMVKFTDYVHPSMFSGLRAEDQIAVIYCDGEIVRGAAEGIGLTGTTMAASDDLTAAFKTAREDDSVRAVILRVDSPGGSVIASELIRHAAELTEQKKPIIVSMSGYAASGGYWVSTPATWIIAEPGTITGSIGVLGGKFNIGPASEKIYLNSGAVTRGANVEMFDEMTDFTPEQRKIFEEQMLGQTYQKFLKVVADSRRMTVDQVNTIAQGRVWTGDQAAHLKLVDQLGGFADALEAAKKAAKLPLDREVALIELPEQPGPLAKLLSGGLVTTQANPLPPAMRSMMPPLMLLKSALDKGGAVGAVYCPIVPIW